jgi:hypothetical protein
MSWPLKSVKGSYTTDGYTCLRRKFCLEVDLKHHPIRLRRTFERDLRLVRLWRGFETTSNM